MYVIYYYDIIFFMKKKEKLDNIFSKLVFIDTETTGIEEEDRIFQVAYDFDNNEYNEMFLPPLPIKIEAMETTHFTNKDVENKPVFEKSKMQKHLQGIFQSEVKSIDELIGRVSDIKIERNIFVAHNAKFDIKMLEKDNVKVYDFIDTLKVAQFLDTKSHFSAYRLQYLRYALDLDVKDAAAHDALGDIRVLKALFIRLYERMLLELKKPEKVIFKMIEISRQPVLIKKFVFGKYKGDLVEEVVKKDKGYLEWLLKQKETQASEGDIDEDWLFTLKKYLR